MIKEREPPGIYKISNIKNNKVYVGSSTRPKNRWNQHILDLKFKRHRNCKLQKDYNKYGADIFKMEIVEFCSRNKLIKQEDYWIKKLKALHDHHGYNLKDASQTKFNDIIRKKISDKKKKSWKDPVYRKIRSNQSKKMWKNPEFRKRFSEISKKMWEDPKYQKKMHNAFNDPKLKKIHSKNGKAIWANPITRKKIIRHLHSKKARKNISKICFRNKRPAE